MVIYIKGDGGKLKHSALRESNYSNENLKNILTRLKQLNPSIELDPEYEDFLSGKLGSQNPWGFNNLGTKNTKKSVEDRLRAKGEAW